MGCFSSVNLSVALEKKDTNIKPLNKTELQNESFKEHSCKIEGENNNKNNNNNLNINNIPLDVLKSYQYYLTNKNYKSCEVGKEDENKKDKKIKMLKINVKNNNLDKKETKEEENNKNINIIEDMDVDINIYKKYIIKDDNKKKQNKENNINETKLDNNGDSKEIEDESNYINNSDKKKVLRKSIEDRITKYNIKKDEEKNKELEDSICNLGVSYVKNKGE